MELNSVAQPEVSDARNETYANRHPSCECLHGLLKYPLPGLEVRQLLQRMEYRW